MNSPIKPQRTVPALNDSWQHLRREIDRVFDRFSDGFESFSLQPFSGMQRLWNPGVTGLAQLAIDISEAPDAFTINAELPGVAEKDIEVTADENTLTIRGEKRQAVDEKKGDHHVSERSFGAFQRVFTLPRGTDTAGIQARFHNGVLTLTVPKTAAARAARKVEVKAA